MKRSKKILLALISIIILLLIVIVGTPVCGTTFRGRVIDAETKQPIEGAVVVASWSGERGTPTGGTSRLEDVKEILTDKNGEWMIKGKRGTDLQFYTILTFFTGTYYTRPPLFIVFKPGYCAWPDGFMIDACSGKMIPRGHDKVADGETIELPRLTNREDRLKSSAISPPHNGGDGTRKKIRNLIRLLNEEYRYLGVPEYPVLKESDNEK